MNQPGSIPTTVKTDRQKALYQRANDLRRAIKDLVVHTNEVMKEAGQLIGQEGLSTEVIANATLAKRHLEDASFRFGHVLMHTDGGASVYDRSTASSIPAGNVAELQPSRKDD